MKWWEFLNELVIIIPLVIVILNTLFNMQIIKNEKRWFIWGGCTLIFFIVCKIVNNYALDVNAVLIVTELMCLLCMKGKFKIIKTFFSYFIIAIVYALIKAVFVANHIDIKILENISTMTVIVVAMLLYKKIRFKKFDENVNVIVKILIGSMIFTGLLGIVGPLVGHTGYSGGQVALVIIAVLLFIVSSILLMQFSIKNQDYKIKEKLSKEKLILLNNYFDEVKKKNDDIRRFKHDYKNHIRSIEYLLTEEKYEEALEYIHNLNENQWINEKVIDVGHDFVNAILNDYIHKSKENNIKINVSGIIPGEIDVSDIDWSTILSNAMSNAIEATVKLEDDTDKFIDVKFKNIDSKLVIEIINKVSMDIDIIDGKIKTTKPDKENHGFGIKNMKSVIEKYHGSLFYEYSKDEKLLKTILVIIKKV